MVLRLHCGVGHHISIINQLQSRASSALTQNLVILHGTGEYVVRELGQAWGVLDVRLTLCVVSSISLLTRIYQQCHIIFSNYGLK